MTTTPPSSPPRPSANLADLIKGRMSERGAMEKIALTRSQATDQLMSELPRFPAKGRRGSGQMGAGALPIVIPDDEDGSAFRASEDSLGYTVDDVLSEGRLTPEQQMAQIALAVRNSHEPGKPDIKWYLVKQLYIGGWTQEKIHEVCNISLSWIKEKSRVENWQLQRELHEKSLEALVKQRIAAAEERWIDEHNAIRRDIFETMKLVAPAIRDALTGKTDLKSLAAILPLLDQIGVSQTGAPSIFSSGGPTINNNIQQNTLVGQTGAQLYPPGSLQATVLDAVTLRDGESEEDLLRRLAEWVYDQYTEFDRMDFYAERKLDGEDARRLRLGGRLPALRAPSVIESPPGAVGDVR